MVITKEVLKKKLASRHHRDLLNGFEAQRWR